MCVCSERKEADSRSQLNELEARLQAQQHHEQALWHHAEARLAEVHAQWERFHAAQEQVWRQQLEVCLGLRIVRGCTIRLAAGIHVA